MTALAAGDTRPASTSPVAGRVNGVRKLLLVVFRVDMAFLAALTLWTIWAHKNQPALFLIAILSCAGLAEIAVAKGRRAVRFDAEIESRLQALEACAWASADEDAERRDVEARHRQERRERELQAAADAEYARKVADWEDLLDSAVPINGIGYLYVIAYSTSVVKVGQTGNPKRRFAEHRRDAMAFGAYPVDFWVSEPHAGYLQNEADLIAECMRVSTYSKREYFHDVDFGATVTIASDLVRGGAKP